MDAEQPVDIERIIRCLDRHGVEYLVVGGVGARLYGAQRQTSDFDSLPAASKANLGRLAAAMRELHAYLRVGGLSDEEARRLPVQLDEESLARMDISTWRTDAGDFDVLKAIPTRGGGRASYLQLASRSEHIKVGNVTVRVAALADIVASKEWANRPKDKEALDELRRLRDDRGTAPS